MSRNFSIYLMYVIFSTLFTTIVYGEQCVQKSPCSCEFDDGREIDLHKLDMKNFIQTPTLNNLTYFFHACADADLTIPKALIPPNVTINNQCKSTSVCLLNLNDNTAKSLGQANEAKILPISNSEIYNILYTHNKTETIIVLACSNYPDSVLDIKRDDTSNAHNLIFFSPHNCPFTEYTGLSTGSVLVILLFVFTIVYLFGGALVLHLLRGARGREMIPNIDFWTDFPILVKDGAVFLQNGCKPVVLSTSESYDRI